MTRHAPEPGHSLEQREALGPMRIAGQITGGLIENQQCEGSSVGMT